MGCTAGSPPVRATQGAPLWMIESLIHPHVQIPNIEDGKTAAISVGSLGYSLRRQGGTKGGWGALAIRWPSYRRAGARSAEGDSGSGRKQLVHDEFDIGGTYEQPQHVGRMARSWQARNPGGCDTVGMKFLWGAFG